MKKSLSAILATSMAFSMFASAAFAADELNSEAKFQALKTAGIFQGYPDGQSHLEANMTRAEFAKALAALLDLAPNAAAAASFTDVPANHWAIGEIGALAEKKILEGIGAGKFGPKLNVTLEQVAKIVVLATGLTPKADATVEGKTSAWATGYVAAAVEAGLLPKVADYTALAKRSDLVDASYTVYEKVQVAVKSTKVVDAKNIEVTFTDGGVVKKELAEALKVGVATKVSVDYKGKSYEVEVKLEAITATAKLTGADKLELTFNQAVDTTKAVIAVKNAAGNTVNQTAAFNTDKTVATLEFASALVEGEYTVSVTGLQDAAITATFKAEDEKVAKIEFTSDKAVITRATADADDKSYTTGYKITNQYGEDVTADYEGQLTFTVGRGNNATLDADNGVLTVTGAGALTLNDKIAVSVLDPESSTFANTVLTVVSPAKVAEISIDKLYNADGDTLTDGDDATGAYYLIVSAKDQYGNAIGASAENATNLGDDLVVSVSNKTYANVAYQDGSTTKGDFTTVTIDDVDYLALPLDGTVDAGTSKVTVVSTTTGKLASFDVVVKESVKADSVTFSAPTFAAAGEEFSVPFTAVDQFGKAITSASDLTAGFNSISVGGNTLGGADGKEVKFVTDYVTGKVSLKVDGLAEGTYVLTAVTGTNKVVNQTIKVGAAAVPTTITGVDSDFAKVYAIDATDTLDIAGDVIIQDQYGRVLDQGNDDYPGFEWADYAVTVTEGGSYVSVNDDLLFTALKKGTQKFTLALTKEDAAVKGSAYSLNLKVVEKADIATYELADFGKLLGSGVTGYTADHAITVSVNGKLADGSVVAVPASYFKVNTTGDLEATGATLTYDTADIADASETTENVIVTVDGANGPVVLTKAVTISDVAPKATTLSLEDGDIGTVAGTLVVSAAKGDVTGVDADAVNAAILALVKDVVVVKDQYGIAMDEVDAPATAKASFKFAIAGLGDNTLTTGADVISAGETFNVTVVSGSAAPITIKVVVTE